MHWQHQILTEAIKTCSQYDVILITQVAHLLKRVWILATQLLKRKKTHKILMMFLQKRVKRYVHYSKLLYFHSFLLSMVFNFCFMYKTKRVGDDSINNEFNSTAESSKDFDAGSIFEEDNADERSHVSEQVCDVVYVFHNVSFHSLFCSIFDTYVA